MPVTRTPHSLGEIVMVNLHLSAYDKDGMIKAQQMEYLRDFILNEFSLGHHVIVGGDWNQNPPGFEGLTREHQWEQSRIKPIQISGDFMPDGWSWAWDEVSPTHRDGATAFDKSTSSVTSLDFFLCSPNVDVIDVRCLTDGFRYSDHEPVLAHFGLR